MSIKSEKELQKTLEEVLQNFKNDEKKKLEKKTVPELTKIAKEKGITGYSKMKKAELIEAIFSESLISKATITITRNNLVNDNEAIIEEQEAIPVKKIKKDKTTIEKGKKSRKLWKRIIAFGTAALIIFGLHFCNFGKNKKSSEGVIPPAPTIEQPVEPTTYPEISQAETTPEIIEGTFFDAYDDEQVHNRAVKIKEILDEIEKDKNVKLAYEVEFIEKALRYYAGTTKEELSLEEAKEMLDMLDAIWNAEDTHAAGFFNGTKEAKEEDVISITELFFYDGSDAQALAKLVDKERSGMVSNQLNVDQAEKHARNFLELFVNSWIHVSENNQYNVFELETTGYEMVLDSFILHTAIISGTELLSHVTYPIKGVVIEGNEVITDVTISDLIEEANKANCPGKADNGDDILINKFTSDFIGSIHEANFDLSGQPLKLTK